MGCKRIFTVLAALESCQSPLRTRRGKPYIHQETVNTGNWASKQKKIYIPPSSHWHSLAQWFVPKYKTSWKAITAPNGESYITLPTNSIFLPSKRMSTVPPTWSPGHLGQWLKPRYSARKQCWTIQPLSPGISEDVQTKTTAFLSPFRTFPMTLHAPTRVTLDLPPPWVH